MRYLTVAIFIVASWQFGFAQQRDLKARLKSAKIGIITERLNLSSKQAQTFWPLYNELNSKKKELKIELAKAKIDIQHSELNDENANAIIELYLNNQQKELDLDREYMEKFKEVITPKQVVQLIKVEEDFKKMILQKLRERQQNRRPSGGG
ncbi:MAG: hypothetical protein O6848_08550 [Bacteroidetes bacterium]|nr:hypothetical protein [Bacteroidota bacterium]